MQSASDLLSSLLLQGVKIWTEDGDLHFQAPRGTLPPEALNRVRTLKGELIELLASTEFHRHVPLQPRAPGCQVPLTAFQLRWHKWITERTGGQSKRTCFAMRVIGPVNIDLLRRSLEAVVGRHESLRTRIVVRNDGPGQHIDAPYELQLEVIDLTQMPRLIADGEAMRLGEQFADEKIDLSLGPLFAAKVFRLPNREHVLILALDHIITDGVSNTLLCTEMWTLYHQAAQGSPLSLPEPRLQFGDYAVWQQRTHDVWLKTHEAYWKNRLIGAARIQLPLTDGLAEVKHPIGAMLEIPFGHVLSNKLRDMARRERTLLPLVVLAIFVAVMSKWCGQRDLIVTFLSNGRHRSELQSMIGFLATMLHLRIEITRNDSFLTLLERVNLEYRSACEHHDFDRVPDLIPECTTELHFNWLPTAWMPTSVDRSLEADDALQIQPFPLRVILPFKFIPWFSDSPAGIHVTVGYRPDLFAPSTIERFGLNLRLVAEEILQRPLARVIPILMSLK